MRLATLVGTQNGNVKVLRKQVRTQFKKNMHETDPKKIEKFRDEYVPKRVRVHCALRYCGGIALR